MKRRTDLKPLELEPKRYRRETKSSRRGTMAPYQGAPTTEEALDYLKTVTSTFEDEKGKYDEFLKVLRDFQNQIIDTTSVVTRVQKLFRGHPALLHGFNAFLPGGYQIVDTAVVELSSSSDKEDSKSDEEQTSNRKRRVDIREALKFVHKVKSRFRKQEHIYNIFLEHLDLYKQGRPISEVKREITELFGVHADLVKEFSSFLPHCSDSNLAYKPAGQANSGRDDTANASSEVQELQEKDGEKAIISIDLDGGAEGTGDFAHLHSSTQAQNLTPVTFTSPVQTKLDRDDAGKRSSLVLEGPRAKDAETTDGSEEVGLVNASTRNQYQFPVSLGPTGLGNAVRYESSNRLTLVQQIYENDDKRVKSPGDLPPCPSTGPHNLSLVPLRSTVQANHYKASSSSQVQAVHEKNDGSASPFVVDLSLQDAEDSLVSPLPRRHNLSIVALRSSLQTNPGQDGKANTSSLVQAVHEKNDGGKSASPFVDLAVEDAEDSFVSPLPRRHNLSIVALRSTLQTNPGQDGKAYTSSLVQEVHENNDGSASPFVFDLAAEDADDFYVPPLPRRHNLSIVALRSTLQTNPGQDGKANTSSLVQKLQQKKGAERPEYSGDGSPIRTVTSLHNLSPVALRATVQANPGYEQRDGGKSASPIDVHGGAEYSDDVHVPPPVRSHRLSPLARRPRVQTNPGRDGKANTSTQVQKVQQKKDGARAEYEGGAVPLGPGTRPQNLSHAAFGPTLQANPGRDGQANRSVQVPEMHENKDGGKPTRPFGVAREIERTSDAAFHPPARPHGVLSVAVGPPGKTNFGSDGEGNQIQQTHEKKAGKRTTSSVSDGGGAEESGVALLSPSTRPYNVASVAPTGRADSGGDPMVATQLQQVPEKNDGKGADGLGDGVPSTTPDDLSSVALGLNVARKKVEKRTTSPVDIVPGYSSPKVKKQRQKTNKDEDQGTDRSGSEDSLQGEAEQNEVVPLPQLPKKRSSARIADELMRRQCQAAEVGVAAHIPPTALLSEEDQRRIRLQQLEEEKKSLMMQTRQREYLEKINQTLGRSHGSKKLSKCLTTFRKQVITCPELRTFVREVFEDQEIDFSQCKRYTPSYYLLPNSYIKPFTSRRTELGRRVLNDSAVSVGYVGDSKPNSHDESSSASKRIGRDAPSKQIAHDKRLAHEEKVAQCEDDQFELDVLRGTTASTIERVTEMLRVMAKTSALDDPCIDLEYYLTPIHIRCIERIYGDFGGEVLDLLWERPDSVLPVILHRLKQKEEDQWPEYESKMNKKWAEVHLENYHKSLDYSLSCTKENDKIPLGIDSFSTSPEINQDQGNTVVAVANDGRVPSTPCLSFENPDLESVYLVIKYLLEEVQLTEDQFKKFSEIWSRHVDSIVGVPSGADCEGDTDARAI